MAAQYNDPEAFIPEDAPALYGLISLIPQAHGIPEDDLEGLKRDSWTDEDAEWEVQLNGAGKTYTPAVEPSGDDYPPKAVIEFPAGTFLVKVDGEALVLCHPTHLEWYTNRGAETATKAWESAAIRSVHDRLEDVGLDEELPPAEAFIAPKHRDHFDGGEA